MEPCSVLSDTLMGKESEREWMYTHICMTESLRCSPETITLLIGYTPVQNKKFKINSLSSIWHSL